jgi:hypothetical protein
MKPVGLTVLYRRDCEWRVFENEVPPAEIDAAESRCKLGTASPWIWWGPKAIADWMVENPRKRPEDIPRGVLTRAKAQMEAEIKRLKRTLDTLTLVSQGIAPRPTKREVGKAQKAEAARRRR